MKKTYKISVEELEFLRRELKKAFLKYEHETNDIKWNSYPDSYDSLSESIFTITKQQGKTYHVGMHPLRDLLYYKNIDKSYHINTLDALYLYIKNESRSDFFNHKRTTPKIKLTIDFIKENINMAENVYKKGDVLNAAKTLQVLEPHIDFNHLNKKFKKEYALFFKVYAHIQMQLGNSTHSPRNAWNLIQKGHKAFVELNNPLEIAYAMQLKGIICSQQNNYKEAIEYYRKALKITEEYHLESAKAYIMHDMAVGSFRYAYLSRNPDYINNSKYNFIKSQKLFKDFNPQMASMSSIRLAELRLNLGQLGRASEILDEYENPLNFMQLTKPYQAIFLRINAERYFYKNNLEQGIQYLNVARQLNHDEGFTHQLKSRNQLMKKHSNILNPYSFEGFNISEEKIILK